MDSLYKYFDSISESSISEDLEGVDSLYSGGQAYSLISSLEETIENIDDFLLFDREFMNGDIVCLAADPQGQLGKVVNVEMTVNLETTNGSKIKNVNCRDLQRLWSVSVGDFVILGVWLGKVEKLVDCVTVLFDNGSKCQFSSCVPEIITRSPNIVGDSLYPLYPGQRVWIRPSSVIGSSQWLCGTRKLKQEQATISNVDAFQVCINWLCCAIKNCERGCSPNSIQDPKNLILLSTFPHVNWQLCDWCVLLLEQSLLYPYSSSGLVRGQKISEILIQNRDNFREIAVIVKTKTKIDVLLQNGSQSLGLDSHLLLSVNIVDAHDFWPHAFVLEKGTVDDFQVPDFQRWGIIKSVDPKERTANVFFSSLPIFLFVQVERNWPKKFHKEWWILERNLPGDYLFPALPLRQRYMREAPIGYPNSKRNLDGIQDHALQAQSSSRSIYTEGVRLQQSARPGYVTLSCHCHRMALFLFLCAFLELLGCLVCLWFVCVISGSILYIKPRRMFIVCVRLS